MAGHAHATWNCSRRASGSSAFRPGITSLRHPAQRLGFLDGRESKLGRACARAASPRPGRSTSAPRRPVLMRRGEKRQRRIEGHLQPRSASSRAAHSRVSRKKRRATRSWPRDLPPDSPSRRGPPTEKIRPKYQEYSSEMASHGTIAPAAGLL